MVANVTEGSSPPFPIANITTTPLLTPGLNDSDDNSGGGPDDTSLIDYHDLWMEMNFPNNSVLFDFGESRIISIVKIPEQTPWLVYLCVVVVLVPGVIGNALLFLLSFRSAVRSFSYSIYLAAMAISDSLSLLVYYVELISQTNSFILADHFPNVHVCRGTMLLLRIVTVGSPWLLVAFSIDRHVAIVWPLKRKSVCTLRKARCLCVGVYVVCLLVLMPTILQMTMVPLSSGSVCGVMSSPSYSIIALQELFYTVLPALLLVSLNVHSLAAIKTAMKERMTMAAQKKDAEPAPADPPAGTNEQRGSSQTADQVAGQGQGRTRAEGRENVQGDGGQFRGQTDRTQSSAGQRGQRDREAEMATKARAMGRALLTLPLFFCLTMTPQTLVISTSHFTSFYSAEGSRIFDVLMLVEPYTRIIFTLGYAVKFYLLIATSKAYRAIASKMLNGWLRRQAF